MATLIIEVVDASHNALDDLVDVDLRSRSTGGLLLQLRGVSGKKKIRVNDVVAGQPYTVRVMAMRHLPVQQIVSVPMGRESASVEVGCPVDPRRVVQPVFPDYASLEPALCRVLDLSTLESEVGPQPAPRPPQGDSPGERLFIDLNDGRKAGLLNLYAKMRHTLIADTPTWDYVTDVYRIRGDRIFANVTVDFRDLVKSEVATGGFRNVPAGKHAEPPGFVHAGSFKTMDRYGNLQLTFFSSADSPLCFKVDADIDNAAGFEHAFQVIGNDLTGRDTNPYDIHQILAFYQRIDAGYGLPV